MFDKIPEHIIDFLDGLPKPIPLIAGIFILVMLWKLCHSFIIERWRDLLFVVKDFIFKFVIKRETFRLTNVLNWKIKRDFKKGEYSYDKVKVSSIKIDEKQKANVAVFKRSAILVLRTKISKNNESENLARVTAEAVILGFLANVKKYLSSELSTAINNVEIARQLREMKDYIAEKIFITNMVKDQGAIEQHMNNLHDLSIENLYKTVFIPYLRMIDGFFSNSGKQIEKDSEDLLSWLSDYQQRLRKPFEKRFFLKTQFVYVRSQERPTSRHIMRANSEFNDLKCDIVIIMGWKPYQEDVNEISKTLTKMGYPRIKKFNGMMLENKVKTTIIIHKRDQDVVDF